MFRYGKHALIFLIVLGVGLFVGHALKGKRADESIQPAAVTTAEAEVRDVHNLYVCPMMCVPPMAQPGNCPICGMELVRFNSVSDAPAQMTSTLNLTPDSVVRAGIRLARVERKYVSAEVRLFGKVDYDPAHTAVITAFTPGVIDRVYVKRAGQFVRWGDPLFDFYSSDLLQTQKALLEAVKYVPSFLAFQESTPHIARDAPVQARERSQGSDEKSKEVKKAMETIDALRLKLSILGMPKRDIDEFMKLGEGTGIATVYASMYGQVVEQNAYEGTFVNTGTPIFTIADPQFVWIRLDAYETDYPWVRKGQELTVATDAYPGETFKGKVVYIDPVFNTKSRSFGIGAICSEDQGGRLKAGMLVRAVINAQLTEDGRIANEGTRPERAPLVIPASAPLITGKRAVVYVAKPGVPAAFEGREVQLGPKANDYYVVADGLREGEQVVASGNFKIDSALQILAKSSMMGMAGGAPADEHQRPGGSDLMSEDYSAERMRSRMESGADSGEPGSSRTMGQEALKGPARDERLHRQRAIQRRKPGTYSDTTRLRPFSQE